MTKPPPEPGTQPIVTCPSCGHGIDSHHGWGGPCEVGDKGVLCQCYWTPNDIAARRWADLVEAVEALRREAGAIRNRLDREFNVGKVYAYERMLKILREQP